MSETSYVELCLRALPLEKQAAARQAFHDLVDGAPDDTMLSRLLIVLEATAAYGRTIPAEIAAAMRQGIAGLDSRLAQLNGAQGVQSHDMDAQMARLFEPLAEQRQLLESVRFAVEQVERDVQRLRYARLTVVLLLMAASAIAGGIGVVSYFKPRYQAAQSVSEAMDYLAERGVHIQLAEDGQKAVVFTVQGPATRTGTDWMRDAKGRITGAQIVFSR